MLFRSHTPTIIEFSYIHLWKKSHTLVGTPLKGFNTCNHHRKPLKAITITFNILFRISLDYTLYQKYKKVSISKAIGLCKVKIKLFCNCFEDKIGCLLCHNLLTIILPLTQQAFRTLPPALDGLVENRTRLHIVACVSPR